jgi:hypothetical protein
MNRRQKAFLKQANEVTQQDARAALELFRRATQGIDMTLKPKLKAKMAKLEAVVAEEDAAAAALQGRAPAPPARFGGASHPNVVKHLHAVTHRAHPEAEESALFELAEEVGARFVLSCQPLLLPSPRAASPHALPEAAAAAAAHRTSCARRSLPPAAATAAVYIYVCAFAWLWRARRSWTTRMHVSTSPNTFALSQRRSPCTPTLTSPSRPALSACLPVACLFFL